ncbi:MAG TPA: ATP-binding protein [Pseudonocardia sp.]|jgi:hypothetical protein
MVDPAGLDACWRRLDDRLLAAVAAAEKRLGAPGGDPFRGLHLAAPDVTATFGEAAGVPRLGVPPDGPPGWAEPLEWLSDAFGLTEFDLDVVLICLAPEVDLRYERVYAYLCDDVRRRRPTVELVLDLLCGSAEDKLRCRDRFAPGAPLSRHEMLHLDPPDGIPHAPLLAHTPRLDAQIVDVLLGQGGVDRRLAAWCRLVAPDPDKDPEDPGVEGATVDVVTSMVAAARARDAAPRLYLHGTARGARLPIAGAVAGAAGVALLCVDGTAAARRPELLPLVFREARLHGAVLFLDDLDALREDTEAWALLLRTLASDQGITVLAGARAWPLTGDVVTGVVTLPVEAPGAPRRRACWASALARYGVELGAGDLDVLAARYRLDAAQIEDAAAACWPTAALRHSSVPGLADVSAAARDRSGHELAALARRVRPRCGWRDLVLPSDALAQLGEVCDRARYRERVVTEWGFGRLGRHGLGTSVLFTGGSGTGKTIAAQLIAGELGLDLYTVDLARVVSKYIGETEKNLGRIFDAAADADAVLFFDEADALFGKRSDVQDSHDRYANIEVSFLLQRIEQFEGVAILATNLRQHLDEALLRRLAFAISFPFPDEESRRRIWEVVWPDVPRAACVDLDLLARRFVLPGGNIRNIAFGASFLAAADGGVVRMAHLMHATRREYQKLGKALGPSDLAVVPG